MYNNIEKKRLYRLYFFVFSQLNYQMNFIYVIKPDVASLK